VTPFCPNINDHRPISRISFTGSTLLIELGIVLPHRNNNPPVDMSPHLTQYTDSQPDMPGSY